MARELAPAGLRSSPLFKGRFATRREQAPSPQGLCKTAAFTVHSVKDALGRRRPYNARRFLG
ncbi:hypothetical protein C3E97_017715 [Pseudomonas sp. MWU12-2115]|nr:hypothetical protein C3E97_017715 [Pseudomonas sp. MWU12-2115]